MVLLCGIQMIAATSTAIRIAIPPSSGVSLLARPRSLGLSTASTRRATRAASGVSSAATAIATRKAYTASQYRMACP